MIEPEIPDEIEAAIEAAIAAHPAEVPAACQQPTSPDAWMAGMVAARAASVATHVARVREARRPAPARPRQRVAHTRPARTVPRARSRRRTRSAARPVARAPDDPDPPGPGEPGRLRHHHHHHHVACAARAFPNGEGRRGAFARADRASEIAA